MFLLCFRFPTNIPRYMGETNLGLCLKNYHLACREGHVDNDYFIICNSPLYLANSARMWLKHVPTG